MSKQRQGRRNYKESLKLKESVPPSYFEVQNNASPSTSNSCEITKKITGIISTRMSSARWQKWPSSLGILRKKEVMCVFVMTTK